MFRVSEEVSGFKFMFASFDGYVHLMVIRKPLVGYEAWCRTESRIWMPMASEVSCHKCMEATLQRIQDEE